MSSVLKSISSGGVLSVHWRLSEANHPPHRVSTACKGVRSPTVREGNNRHGSQQRETTSLVLICVYLWLILIPLHCLTVGLLTRLTRMVLTPLRNEPLNFLSTKTQLKLVL